jgi:hypothetical protein
MYMRVHSVWCESDSLRPPCVRERQPSHNCGRIDRSNTHQSAPDSSLSSRCAATSSSFASAQFRHPGATRFPHRNVTLFPGFPRPQTITLTVWLSLSPANQLQSRSAGRDQRLALCDLHGVGLRGDGDSSFGNKPSILAQETIADCRGDKPKCSGVAVGGMCPMGEKRNWDRKGTTQNFRLDVEGDARAAQATKSCRHQSSPRPPITNSPRRRGSIAAERPRHGLDRIAMMDWSSMPCQDPHN